MSEIILESLGVRYPASVLSGDPFASTTIAFSVSTGVRLALGECCTLSDESQRTSECFVACVEEEGEQFILSLRRLPIADVVVPQ